MNNIAAVDTIVQQVESLFDSFYNSDNDTSYIFTADHGMSVIGNHGDGRQYLLPLSSSIRFLTFPDLPYRP